MIAKYLHATGTFLIGISLIAAVFIGNAALKNRSATRTIIVTGKAVRQLESNQSKITGSWTEKAANSADARAAVQKKAAAGIEAIKQLGIADKDIKTVDSSVYPNYDYGNYSGNPKIVDYTGNSTIQITLTDTTKADATLAALTKSGTTNTSGPSFGLSTEASDALQKELKVAAVADAHTQGLALAKEAGGKLGAVQTIAGGDLSNGNTPYPLFAAGMASALSDANTPKSDLQVGQNEVSVTVQVTYSLR